MVRSRLRLTIYMGAAMLAVGGGAVAAVAATTPTTKAAGPLTATFRTDSDWGSGYQARYTIKNTGSSAITGWQVVFALPAGAKLGSTWDAAATTSGSTVTAKDRGYNASIAAGGSAEFGFIVAGRGAPTSCTVNGAACSGGPVTTTPPTTAPTSRPPTTAPTTPPPTTTPPATTPPPASGGSVLVAPYVDMGLLSNSGSPTLAQLATSGGVKSYTLAFVTGAGCKASWFGAFDPRT